MKGIKISNFNRSFAMFLMAMDTTFTYSYNRIFVGTTSDVEKFKNWCLRSGVRESEINEMSFEFVEDIEDAIYL
ncbi:MAG: hypothetical protein NC044_05455 [Prevotella sp.]|nr:hypothetical protein [Lachnospiraceae bacterium]MCM1379564.1 hypothetical protein [Bacteroides sp.]MCM1445834.1 hypothetical protein [Prevotella sp.]